MLRRSSRILFFLGTLSVSVSSLEAVGSNYLFDPTSIFQPHPSGGRRTNPVRTTHADLLHQEGIKGCTKKGTRFTVALIDSHFNPNFTKTLSDKGLIHPHALSWGNSFILAPGEKYDFSCSNLEGPLKHAHLRKNKAKTAVEKREAQKEIDVINHVLELRRSNKRSREALFKQYTGNGALGQGALNEGSGMMDAFHLIAPEAQILPIDIDVMACSRMNKDGLLVTGARALTKALKKALRYRVDAIAIGSGLETLNEKGIVEIKSAVGCGIPVFIGVGGDSNKKQGVLKRISQGWDAVQRRPIRSKMQELFEKVDRKGIHFVGALGYKENGREKISEHTQLPDESTEPYFTLAPGEKLPIRTGTNPLQLLETPRFSAAQAAGGFILLKQDVWSRGYQYPREYDSVDRLLKAMHDSGRDVTYKKKGLLKEETFKALDLQQAQKLAREMCNPHPLQPQPAPKKPAPKKPAPQKPVPQKPVPAPQKPVLKKPAPQKPVSQKPVPAPQKPVLKKPAPKKLVPQKSVLKKPAPQKPAPQKPAPKKPAPKKLAPQKPVLKKTAPQKLAPKKLVHQKPSPKKSVVKKIAAVRKAMIRKKVVTKKAIDKKGVAVKRASPQRASPQKFSRFRGKIRRR